MLEEMVKTASPICVYILKRKMPSTWHLDPTILFEKSMEAVHESTLGQRLGIKNERSRPGVLFALFACYWKS